MMLTTLITLVIGNNNEPTNYVETGNVMTPPSMKNSNLEPFHCDNDELFRCKFNESNKEDFFNNNLVQDQNTLFVVTGKWCKGCSDIEAIGKEVSITNKNVVLVESTTKAGAFFVKKFNIHKLPSIHLFPKKSEFSLSSGENNIHYYKGARNATNIGAFMENHENNLEIENKNESDCFIDNVIKINQNGIDNFEQITQAGSGHTTGSWFVKFYATWCGHCVRMSETYKELANQVHADENLPNFYVAEIESKDFQNVNKRFGVKGFPTIILFHNGFIFRYKGSRTSIAMHAYLKDVLAGTITSEERVPAMPSWFENKKDDLKMFYQFARKNYNKKFSEFLKLRKSKPELFYGFSSIVVVVPFVLLYFANLIRKAIFEDIADAAREDEKKSQ